MPDPSATVNVDVLATQVDGLAKDFDGLQKNIDARFTQFGTQIAEQIRGIVSKLDERSKVPWAAVGIMLSVVGSVGSAYILPLKDGLADMRAAIASSDTRMASAFEKMADRSVTIREFDQSTKTDDRRFSSIEADVAKMKGEMVPREEHRHVWEQQDRWMENLSQRVDGMRGLSAPQKGK